MEIGKSTSSSSSSSSSFLNATTNPTTTAPTPLFSSSISSDIFSGKESPASAKASSPGIFSSLFPPASTVVRRDSLHLDSFVSSEKQNPELPVLNVKNMSADSINQGSGSENGNVPDKDRSSVYLDETVEPCFLSSSLYYGGQDIYSHSNIQAPSTPTIFRKGNGDEAPNASDGNNALRGNWWEGSLYY